MRNHVTHPRHAYFNSFQAHVGKHIFDNVLGPQGLLRSKARILCTNAITWLEHSDEIIMMRQGSILARSTYASVSSCESRAAGHN